MTIFSIISWLLHGRKEEDTIIKIRCNRVYHDVISLATTGMTLTASAAILHHRLLQRRVVTETVHPMTCALIVKSGPIRIQRLHSVRHGVV